MRCDGSGHERITDRSIPGALAAIARTRRDDARGMGQAEALITRSPLLGSKSGQLFGGRRATSSSSRPIGGSAAAAMATASKGGLAYRPPAPEPYPPPFGNLSGAPVADVSPRARKKPAEQTDDTGTQKPTVHNHHPNQPNPTTASRLASTAHGRHGRKKKKPAITAPTTTADGDGPGEVKLPRARVGAWAGRATHGTASLRPLRFVWFRLCAQAQHRMGLALAFRWKQEACAVVRRWAEAADAGFPGGVWHGQRVRFPRAGVALVDASKIR
jgi:hypothetical protein